MFAAAMMPVLYPSTVQEILDFGLHGWAMSRYSGCWVGFKCVADTVESSASVNVDPSRTQIIIPDDFALPPDGLNIRWPDGLRDTEVPAAALQGLRGPGVCARQPPGPGCHRSPNPRLGIVTTGKSYLDVRQALEDLGIDEAGADEIGLRLYKVGMNWPLDPEGVRAFAEGLDEILVVEEKRQVVEYQLKEHLYNWRDDVRPRVIGKFDEADEWEAPLRDWQLPAAGELTPA